MISRLDIPRAGWVLHVRPAPVLMDWTDTCWGGKDRAWEHVRWPRLHGRRCFLGWPLFPLYLLFLHSQESRSERIESGTFPLYWQLDPAVALMGMQ